MKEASEKKIVDKEELKPTVSVLPDFFSNFIDLPKETQRKVVDFFKKFAKNPNLPGTNYEPLGQAGDDRVRSIRIDDAYRGIVYTPAEGRVHLLLRVGIEDDLYKWVKFVKFNTVKRSNEVMVTRLLEKEEPAAASAGSPEEGPLAHCNDDDLKSVGVPPILLPSVRAIGHEHGYDLLSAYLPPGSVMALRFLANETPIEDVRELYLAYGEGKVTSGLSPAQATATLQLMDKMREDRKAGKPVNERLIAAIYKAREDHSESELIEKVVRNYPE